MKNTIQIFKTASLAISFILLGLVCLPAEPAKEPNSYLVPVWLSDYRVEMMERIPARLTVFQVTNAGPSNHSFEIVGPEIHEALTTNLKPGQSETLQIDLKPGTYQIYCPLDNHRDSGMMMTIQVTP